MYIRAAHTISPQISFDQLVNEPTTFTGERVACIEPDYSAFIDAKLMRRMSRIIKMGVASAMECLREAMVDIPDAMSVGTAYGCLADTEQFLRRMVEFNESLLSPTAFIQSTHNTVGAQIALLIKSHQYNNTFVHRGTSFEAAVLDAWALIKEGDAANVLVGGVDEITDTSHQILRRFNLYKKDVNSVELIGSETKGTMAGEGASFFLFDKEKKQTATSRLLAIRLLPAGDHIPAGILRFLEENDLTQQDIGLLITGANGNWQEDAHYKNVLNSCFEQLPQTLTYKQFCGEYPTSSAFALWLAGKIIQTGKIPGRANMLRPGKILIYNNYLLRYPVLYLLEHA